MDVKLTRIIDQLIYSIQPSKLVTQKLMYVINVTLDIRCVAIERTSRRPCRNPNIYSAVFFEILPNFSDFVNSDDRIGKIP